MASSYFSSHALRGLDRIGDILIPRNGDFPSFSEYGAAAHVDDILAYAPPSDVSTLNTVQGLMARMPVSFLKRLAGWMETAYLNEGPAGDILRLLNLGLRGLIFSLYYGDKAGPDYRGPHPSELTGYVINRVED
jgi:hypothetical protein